MDNDQDSGLGFGAGIKRDAGENRDLMREEVGEETEVWQLHLQSYNPKTYDKLPKVYATLVQMMFSMVVTRQ